MSLETYIFIGGCRFYFGGFKLVHPLCGFCFSESVCAIGGSLPSELPLCSDFDFQQGFFVIALASCSPQSTETTSISKPNPTATPSPQQCFSDPEITSLIPWRLPISHSNQNRSPHNRSESAFRFLAPIYNPDACRDNCKGNRQRSHTSNPNELAPLHFPSSEYCHTTLVHFYALRTFPVCTHLYINSVPTHSQVDRKVEGRRCADRAAWTGRGRRA